MPPSIRRSTRVVALRWAKVSRSEVMTTHCQPCALGPRRGRRAHVVGLQARGRDRVQAHRVEHRCGPLQLVDELGLLLGAPGLVVGVRRRPHRRRAVVEAEHQQVGREPVDGLEHLAQHPVQRPRRPVAQVAQVGADPGVVVAVQQRRCVDHQEQRRGIGGHDGARAYGVPVVTSLPAGRGARAGERHETTPTAGADRGDVTLRSAGLVTVVADLLDRRRAGHAGRGARAGERHETTRPQEQVG